MCFVPTKISNQFFTFVSALENCKTVWYCCSFSSTITSDFLILLFLSSVTVLLGIKKKYKHFVASHCGPHYFLSFIYRLNEVCKHLWLSVGVFGISWRHSPVSVKLHVPLWCLSFHPHWTTHQSNIGARWRKHLNYARIPYVLAMYHLD